MSILPEDVDALCPPAPRPQNPYQVCPGESTGKLFSAHGIREFPAPENVHVEVEDDLSPVGVDVDGDPVPRLGDPFFPGDRLRGPVHLGQHLPRLSPTSLKVATCSFGTMRTWTGATGWMSLKARIRSVSMTLLQGISPLTILQKIQSLISSPPVSVRKSSFPCACSAAPAPVHTPGAKWTG